MLLANKYSGSTAPAGYVEMQNACSWKLEGRRVTGVIKDDGLEGGETEKRTSGESEGNGDGKMTAALRHQN